VKAGRRHRGVRVDVSIGRVHRRHGHILPHPRVPYKETLHESGRRRGRRRGREGCRALEVRLKRGDAEGSRCPSGSRRGGRCRWGPWGRAWCTPPPHRGRTCLALATKRWRKWPRRSPTQGAAPRGGACRSRTRWQRR
jgi:hypothetical protein